MMPARSNWGKDTALAVVITTIDPSFTTNPLPMLGAKAH
jgi:hypothetical protein